MMRSLFWWGVGGILICCGWRLYSGIMKSPVRVRLRGKDSVRLIGVKGFHRGNKMLKQWGIDSCDPAAVLADDPDGIVILVTVNYGVICGDYMRLRRG